MKTNELQHYGIIGMKWGIRKDPERAAKKEAKMASKAEAKERKTDNKWAAKHAPMAYAVSKNYAINEIRTNNPSLYARGKNNPNDPKVEREVAQELSKIMNKYIKANFNDAPSGKAAFEVSIDSNNFLILQLREKQVRHSTESFISTFLQHENEVELEELFSKSFPANLRIMNIIEEEDESLMHYGILGMRWGVRRERGPEGRVKDPGKPTAEYVRAKELRAKGIKQLTTSELKELTQRMQLEKQFKDLKKSEISAGRSHVQNVLKQIGTEIVKEVVKASVKEFLGIKKK